LRYKRKTSRPFLSGDAFRENASISITERAELEKQDFSIYHEGVIFCQSELLEDLLLFLKGEGLWKCLVVGNSDRDFEEEIPDLARTFAKSFLQNSLISDNKAIFTLPIGIENLRLGINGMPGNLSITRDWTSRSGMILVGPFSATHKSRNILFNSHEFEEFPFTKVTKFISPKAYSNLVREHKYVICPRGNGLDTHRFWEALYRGAIPIVKTSKWSESLRIHDFPFVEVDSFTSQNILKGVEEAESRSNFKNFRPAEIASLWVDYWESLFLK